MNTNKEVLLDGIAISMATDEAIKEFAFRPLTGNTDVGFEHQGIWVTNPWMEETGRFELTDEDPVRTYGEDNVNRYKEIASCCVDRINKLTFGSKWKDKQGGIATVLAIVQHSEYDYDCVVFRYQLPDDPSMDDKVFFLPVDRFIHIEPNEKGDICSHNFVPLTTKATLRPIESPSSEILTDTNDRRSLLKMSSLWKHYKGGTVTISCKALEFPYPFSVESVQDDEYVIYKCNQIEDNSNNQRVRPIYSFLDTVKQDCGSINRFEFMK